GRHLACGQLAIAEGDRHDDNAVVPRQRAVARPVGPPAEGAAFLDVPLDPDQLPIYRRLADDSPSFDRAAVLVRRSPGYWVAARTAPGGEGRQEQRHQNAQSVGHPSAHGRTLVVRRPSSVVRKERQRTTDSFLVEARNDLAVAAVRQQAEDRARDGVPQG